MSVNPDGMDSIDYSDFEYQQIYHDHVHDGISGDDAITELNSEYEVLGGIGGLDNNEVAELVYMEVQAYIQHDQAENDQDVGSETKFNAIVGANLPNSNDLLPGKQTSPTTTVFTENRATASSNGGSSSEDRVFAPVTVVKTPAFDDQTNGPGGAGFGNTVVFDRPFRQLTGRGPVLDSSDSMNVTSALRQDDEIILATGSLNVHLVWDVAETSDAGRAFSVPMDD